MFSRVLFQGMQADTRPCGLICIDEPEGGILSGFESDEQNGSVYLGEETEVRNAELFHVGSGSPGSVMRRLMRVFWRKLASACGMKRQRDSLFRYRYRSWLLITGEGTLSFFGNLPPERSSLLRYHSVGFFLAAFFFLRLR